MLGSLLSGRWEGGMARDEAGKPLLELDPTCFRQVVNWLVALYRARELAGLPPEATDPAAEPLAEPLAEAMQALAVADGLPAQPRNRENAAPAPAPAPAPAAATRLLLLLAAAGMPPSPPPPSDPSLHEVHIETLRYLGLPLPYIPPPPPPSPPLPQVCRLGPAAFRLLVDRAVQVHGCRRACLSRTGPDLAGGPAVFRLHGHAEVVSGSGGAWVLAPFRVPGCSGGVPLRGGLSVGGSLEGAHREGGAAAVCGSQPPTPVPPPAAADSVWGSSAASSPPDSPSRASGPAVAAPASLYDTRHDVVLGLDVMTSRLSLYHPCCGRHRLLTMPLPDECGCGAVAVFLRAAGQEAAVLDAAAVTAADCRAVRLPVAEAPL
ncbi:hypothetical protein GPECTOR_34g781 [Gonium pectorale]|uniref:Potassium channel tetramerisation-type BTB domain-containing protein n=1 Tax=Gonium pectorale TaxID=33097 RepID=A0A150GCP7_GONPE|nr:hypothetical protein GPECTOR_34g781 [Gonium pectorale]|eukprot:KXZ47622.1 hypothetical protein GPECTOR_34g781 [Gonium pectorale]